MSEYGRIRDDIDEVRRSLRVIYPAASTGTLVAARSDWKKVFAHVEALLARWEQLEKEADRL